MSMFARTALCAPLSMRTLTAARFTTVRAISTTPALWKETGTCKWFDSKKGFGFIVPDDGSGDVFCHQSVIHSDGFRSLDEGEKLEYDLIDDNGRTKADNVTGPDGAFVQVSFFLSHFSHISLTFLSFLSHFSHISLTFLSNFSLIFLSHYSLMFLSLLRASRRRTATVTMNGKSEGSSAGELLNQKLEHV